MLKCDFVCTIYNVKTQNTVVLVFNHHDKFQEISDTYKSLTFPTAKKISEIATVCAHYRFTAGNP